MQVGSLPALVCTALDPIAPHVFTTRDWDLGARRDIDPHRAWDEVADAVAVRPDRLVRVRQVHGSEILVRRVGDAAADGLPTADVIVSNDSAVAIAIQTADCVPLLIADRRTGAVAAAHAGWRGLAAGVPGAAVDALGREFGSRSADLVAAAGPSIGACCYEVGADVHRCFEVAGWLDSATSGWFFSRAQPTMRNPSMAGLHPEPRPGHWYFDGSRAVRDQLESAGVPRDQIFVADLCTASHPGVLCSYRREGNGAGRMAGAIRPARGYNSRGREE